jgi:hypothetical protein
MTIATITGTYATGINLTPTYADPVTVASGAEITMVAGSALYASSRWTIVNYGGVDSASADSVDLAAGGSVTNAGGGIIGGTDGVLIGGAAGTVINAGSIGETGTSYGDAGVKLTAGGYVSNASAGIITGARNGVVIEGGAGTVANAGGITGSGPSGVVFESGGVLRNSSTGFISGANFGVSMQGGAGTVANAGTISQTAKDAAGVYLGKGGSIENTGREYRARIPGENTGLITAAGSYTNGVLIIEGGPAMAPTRPAGRLRGFPASWSPASARWSMLA